MPNPKNLKCRLCLVESDNERMHPLFDKKRLDSASSNQHLDFYQLPLNEKVEYCCGVKLLPKPEMPTKICAKCINMIDMWYNFRQMCFNSQEFLSSQLKVAQAQNSVINNGKETHQMQFEVLEKSSVEYKDVHLIESDDNYEDVDYIEDDDSNEEVLYTEILHDEGDNNNDNDNNAYKDCGGLSFRKQEATNAKTVINQKLFQADLSAVMSVDDYEEVMNYLNAENDDYLEKLIDHCATKNTALRMLRRKAIGSLMRERQPKKTPTTKKVSREKPMKPSIFMCNICGNVYSKKPLFQYHMRMHSEVKPYQCEICNKSFRIMSDLKNHMYRHTGERPFKCKHCERHFMDRSSRHRHERIHTNSRPYTCNICDKSFTYTAILKNHLKRHTGEKDYICAVCNKSFTLAHQLKAHMLTLTHRQKEAAFEAQGYKVIYEASEMTKS